MSKREPNHPRLTALKAISLLRKVEKVRGSNELYEKNDALKIVAEQLENHVAADLTRRRKR